MAAWHQSAPRRPLRRQALCTLWPPALSSFKPPLPSLLCSTVMSHPLVTLPSLALEQILDPLSAKDK